MTKLRHGLAFLFVVLAHPFFAQIIYVNQEASGMNDGTTWEDAFTDLESALTSASNDQSIWIAKGLYHPGGSNPDTNAVFSIRNNLSIYGGFSGNETSVEERDIHANETILSGDLNNDDIPGDFVSHKEDNTLHVIYVDSLLDLVTLDGLTISGGHTGDQQDSSMYYRAGGGVYALSPVHINVCSFENHFGRSGASILLTQGASNSNITESTFSNNKTTDQSAGIYALRISNLKIADCIFKDNETVRGAVYPSYCSDVLVENCLFENNHNVVFNGGAVFSFQNIGLTIRHCDFIRNSAIIGGALVINGTQFKPSTPTNVKIEDCSFHNNIASNSAGAVYVLENPDIAFSNCRFIGDSAGFGGAMYVERSEPNNADTTSLRIDRCLFSGNRADDGGGGAFFLKFTAATVEHCRFESNATNGFNNGGGGHVFINCPGQEVLFRYDTMQYGISDGFGGAATAYGKDAQIQFENCSFNYNISDRLGGAVHHSFAAMVTYVDCEFLGNKSLSRSGGALSLEYDSTTVMLKKSILMNNVSRGNGGAVFAGFGSNRVIIDQCTLSLNQAGFTGGAIMMRETGDDDISELIIRNTWLGYNATSNDGGAIYTEDANVELTNSVLYGNLCNGAGKGGTLFIKATEGNNVEARFLNSTIADNYGGAVNGVVLEDDAFDSTLTVTMQNNIFSNWGAPNYYVETGSPEIISQGGNMSSDESMLDILNHEKDLNQVEPMFANPDKEEYSLKADSPGIDDGISDGAPEFDILGNPRINAPDIGAYENQMPVHTATLHNPVNEALLLLPNPIGGVSVDVILTNPWKGTLEVRLIDLKGQTMERMTIEKTSDTCQFEMPVTNLSAGVYQVLVSNGEQIIGTGMVRI